MHGGFDAVEHFQVQLWELVFLVGGGLLDITQGGGIDDVTHDEALDRLILWDGLSCANASDTLDVPASLLVAAVVTSLDSHLAIESFCFCVIRLGVCQLASNGWLLMLGSYIERRAKVNTK